VEEHNILLTEPPDMTRIGKERMAEILFEQFNVPAICIESAGVLALYSQGIRTGIVVDCGNRTKLTPIADGYPLPHAILQSAFGGLDVDQAVREMFGKVHGAKYNGDEFKADAQRFKESHGYVSMDPVADYSKKRREFKHRMHQGTHLRFAECDVRLLTETLFSAPLPNACKGLPAAINWCVSKCESVLRKDLLGSVILCGGSTCFDGFPERLEYELSTLLSNRAGMPSLSETSPLVRTVAPPNRK
jgi:actin-related protein